MDGLIKIHAEIEGVSPILMHNIRLANPQDPFTKEMKSLTSKRKKEEADHILIQETEFKGGMYYDPTIGPFIPGTAMEAVIVEGGKRDKRGKALKSVLFLNEDKIRLAYEGPRTQEELWNAGEEFVDVRAVGVNGKKCMRCRPKFPAGWRAKFDLDLMTGGEIEVAHVEQALRNGGAFTGLLDFRPRYGRFNVIKFKTA